MIGRLDHTYVHIPSKRRCNVYIDKTGAWTQVKFQDDGKVHDITKLGLYCKSNLQKLPYTCDF